MEVAFRETTAGVSFPDMHCIAGAVGDVPRTDYPDAQSETLGWTNPGGVGLFPRGRDRNTGGQIGGMCFHSNGLSDTPTRFQLDITGAGTLKVACGDADGAQGPILVVVSDSSGTLATVAGTTGGAGNFLDITSTDRTGLTGNTGISVNIDTQLWIDIGDPAGTPGSNSCIAWLEFIPDAGGPAIPLFVHHLKEQRIM